MNGDLISRSALLRRVPVNRKDTGKTAWDWGILYMADIIKTIPAVDAVEVVRCKDCKFRCETDDGEYNPEDIVCTYWATDGLKAYAFCSYGERRTDE